MPFQPQNSPLANQERLTILDSLRGFAIFGILVVNIIAFSLPKHDLNLISFQSSAWYNVFANWLSTHFFEGKFYILFSFLFGIGFSVQLSSIQKKNGNLWAFYPRRLLILFLIGIIHSLLWWGDVLRLYAILGFGLLLLKDFSIKSLLILSALFLGLSAIIPLFPNVFGEFASPNSDDVFKSLWFAFLHMAPTAFALFLLGRVVGKIGFFYQLEHKKSLILKMMAISAIVYLSLKAVLFLFIEPYSQFETLPKTISDMAFTTIYIGILCLLSINDKARYYLTPLSNVGKMALTNYVMQTLFCVVFFKLTGLAGQLQMGALLLISIIIFAIQMAYSHWWLKYFHYGILEWLWRSMTYGKTQPLLKGKSNEQSI